MPRKGMQLKVKKSKDEQYNLYNFNEHDEDVKKKKKNRKKTKNKKTSNIHDFEEETIIGLTLKIKKEELKKVNKNVKNKKQAKKKNKKKEQNLKKEEKIGQIAKNIEKENNAIRNMQTKNKKKKSSKKAKKKRVVSAEEQEKIKKRRQRKIKIAKYSFLTLCVLAAIIGTMTSPLFNIKKITVSGNEKITENEVISLSGITLNENIFKTIISKSEDKILENPYIKSVKIKRKLPTNIEIIIEERKTNFMLEYGSGYVYINNQGYILEVSSEKLNVPILQGAETDAENFTPGNRLCTEDLKKMDTVIKIMDAANNNDIGSLITRIDIQNSENYMIQFEGEGKVAYLGNATDLSTKMLTIKAILERETGIEGEIFVDMDLKTNNPVFRQRV